MQRPWNRNHRNRTFGLRLCDKAMSVGYEVAIKLWRVKHTCDPMTLSGCGLPINSRRCCRCGTAES